MSAAITAAIALTATAVMTYENGRIARADAAEQKDRVKEQQRLIKEQEAFEAKKKGAQDILASNAALRLREKAVNGSTPRPTGTSAGVLGMGSLGSDISADLSDTSLGL